MVACVPARIDWPTSQARAREALDITRQAISDMFALKFDIGEFIITKGSQPTYFMVVPLGLSYSSLLPAPCSGLWLGTTDDDYKVRQEHTAVVKRQRERDPTRVIVNGER